MVSNDGSGPRTWHKWIGFSVGVLVTLPALWLAWISAGGGHGDYLWAKLLFPYTMIVPMLRGCPIIMPLIVVGLVQFPIYGILVGSSASGFKPLSKMIGIIGGFHVATALICVIFSVPNFR